MSYFFYSIYNMQTYIVLGENMKKIVILFIVLSSIITIHSEEYYARSYVVINEDTLQVLEEKNMHSQYSVASISKIMTAIVAIENGNLLDQVLINDVIQKAYGSSVYLQIGDKTTLQDLLYGLLLRSGNDAAIAIADYIGEDINAFVAMMNEKARIIGMKNTIFNNPSGLDERDGGNLSSAYDMAILMAYCMQNDTFAKITGTKKYSRIDNKGLWSNKNRLISSYKYATGGKTGFTEKAKRTLVSSATKNNINLIVVTLNAGNDFAFHEYLYEKYFSQYESIRILDQGINEIMGYEFSVDAEFNYPVLKDNDIKIRYEIDKINMLVNVMIEEENKFEKIYTCPIYFETKQTFIETIMNSFYRLFL